MLWEINYPGEGVKFDRVMGSSRGFFHIACGVVMSKAVGTANILPEITEASIHHLNRRDIAADTVPKAMALHPLVELRSALRV